MQSDARRARRTGLRTFRLPEDLIAALEKEAQDDGTSLNALISSLAHRHAEWDSRAKRFGFISVHGPLFRGLLDRLDDQTLDQLGRTVLLPLWRDMATFFYNDLLPNRILDFLSMRSRHLTYVQTEVKMQDNLYTVVVHHELGPKWSVVLHAALDEMARQAFHTQPKMSVSGTVVTAEFRPHQESSPT